MNTVFKQKLGPIFIMIVQHSRHNQTYISFKDSYRIFKTPRLKVIKAKAKERALFALDIITNRTIYLAIDSTDCDHSRSTYTQECTNRFKAEAFIADTYDWAEGPTYIKRITKQEFIEFEATSRDMALEAFENGHPHLIVR